MSIDDNIFHLKYGCFILIHGTMFSGKTDELVSILRRAEQYAKLNVQAFKPMIDHRYDEKFGPNNISTHDGVSFPAVEVNNTKEIYSVLKPETKVIGIDEIQFFDDEIIDFCIEQRVKDRIVIAEGLLSDYKRELFKFKNSEKNMGDLLVHVNYAIQKTAFCYKCGKPALYTMRKTPDTELVVIGGADKYVAACPDDYVLFSDSKK